MFFLVELGLNVGAGTFRINRKPLFIDLVLVIGSFLRLIPSIQSSQAGSALCIFQIGRFYKVIPYTPRIPRILKTAFKNVNDLMNAFFFFNLVVAIFGTIGMLLFGGRMSIVSNVEGTMTWNSFVDGFLTTFKVRLTTCVNLFFL